MKNSRSRSRELGRNMHVRSTANVAPRLVPRSPLIRTVLGPPLVAAVLACALLGVAGAGVASAAALPLAQSDDEIPFSAYGSRVAWWQYDSATRKYRMMTYFNSLTEATPILSRRPPVGSDLGPDANGDTVAVYSRCDRAYPDCDIYRYSFASKRERRLGGALSTSRYRESFPTIWKSAIAFARTPNRGEKRLTRIYYLGKSKHQVTHLQSGLYEHRYGDGPTGMDLRGGKLVYTWLSDPQDDDSYYAVFSEVRVVPVSGHPGRTIQRASHGEMSFHMLASPTFVSLKTFIWLELDYPPNAENSIVRGYNLRTRTYSVARSDEPPLPCPGPDPWGWVDAVAYGGSRTFAYVAECEETPLTSRYRLLVAPQPSFHTSKKRPPGTSNRA